MLLIWSYSFMYWLKLISTFFYDSRLYQSIKNLNREFLAYTIYKMRILTIIPNTMYLQVLGNGDRLLTSLIFDIDMFCFLIEVYKVLFSISNENHWYYMKFIFTYNGKYVTSHIIAISKQPYYTHDSPKPTQKIAYMLEALH